MAGRFFLFLISTCFGLALAAYTVLSGFAGQPLNIRDFAIFTAAVVRGAPAHLASGTLLPTLRLGGIAFGSPAAVALIPEDGTVHTIPLPPRTAHHETSRHPQHYITFATPDELRDWLQTSLARGDWRHREQLGSMHVFERDEAVLSVMMKFYAGTRVRELGLSVHRRSGQDAGNDG